uniref:hypothetical protein n=1 Tax=uncultured Brachyspira sp. TaxID=221953 RepID=UPI00262361DB
EKDCTFFIGKKYQKTTSFAAQAKPAYSEKQKAFIYCGIIKTIWQYTKILKQIFIKYRTQAKAFYTEIII